MSEPNQSRDDLCEAYLGQLPFDPYPVQEEALFAWFMADQGVLVCAPTGTGKTLIAEAALFEALHTGKRAYYTTPLIALTEQKFREIQDKAVSWGFSADDVGLVTGNRRENPDAPILIVVAEILLNRLLHRDAFDFDEVDSVVMDEFHNFNDRQRGVVWELTLALLPEHVRTLLISATVGNSREFCAWLQRHHNRTLQLVEGTERKVPLTFEWVGDEMLSDHLVKMAAGNDEARRTPALVFCFNRDECWNVAEMMKGKQLIDKARQSELSAELAEYDWSQGAGPKFKQILMRGVGVHHAGVLPKYRRVVEDLFQRKLLSVCVCTETLAAGVNLPARSVVLPTILKGPRDKKKVIDPSSAHQIFGRAGRPQFDDSGYVYVMASEDDVKIAKWKVKYDQIPEDTKDPGLLKAKKALKKKMPKRRSTFQYWTEAQFDKVREAPSANLESAGALPWRMLAHILEASPEVAPLRTVVSKRLMDSRKVDIAQKELDRMLKILWRGGYVTLEPRPPLEAVSPDVDQPDDTEAESEKSEPPTTLFGMSLSDKEETQEKKPAKAAKKEDDEEPPKPRYQAEFAHPTDELYKLSHFRGVNPLFGVFLINQLGIANRAERLQALESTLEMPGSVARYVRVPSQDELPPGPLATNRLDEQLIRLGIVTAEELLPPDPDREYDPYNPPPPPLTLALKLRKLFDHDFPGVEGVRTVPVWCAGEVLAFNGDFNKFVTSNRLQKQEGVVFRHLLRLILLITEFQQMCPPDTTEEEWYDDLDEVKIKLTETCQVVDSQSTEKTIESANRIEDEPR